MRHVIIITREAEKDLDAIRPYYRKQILDAIEDHLSYAPGQESRSRIKRLRHVETPGFRLRSRDYRVFYDVDEAAATVTILRVLDKQTSLYYLREMEGNP